MEVKAVMDVPTNIHAPIEICGSLVGRNEFILCAIKFSGLCC